MLFSAISREFVTLNIWGGNSGLNLLKNERKTEKVLLLWFVDVSFAPPAAAGREPAGELQEQRPLLACVGHCSQLSQVVLYLRNEQPVRKGWGWWRGSEAEDQPGPGSRDGPKTDQLSPKIVSKTVLKSGNLGWDAVKKVTPKGERGNPLISMTPLTSGKQDRTWRIILPSSGSFWNIKSSRWKGELNPVTQTAWRFWMVLFLLSNLFLCVPHIYLFIYFFYEALSLKAFVFSFFFSQTFL